MVKLEVFCSPCCGKCTQAKDMLRAIAEELGQDKLTWRDVNILEEIDDAVDLGVMSIPALAIDGELVFSSLRGQASLLFQIPLNFVFQLSPGR